MEQRRQMMVAWAGYLDQLREGAQVLPLKAAWPWKLASRDPDQDLGRRAAGRSGRLARLRRRTDAGRNARPGQHADADLRSVRCAAVVGLARIAKVQRE